MDAGPGPAEDVVALYQDNAQDWQSQRGTGITLEARWLAAFLDAMPSGPRHILDLGCGSGVPIAAHLIAQGCQITGVDAAPAMIAAARRNFPDQDWLLADLRDLPALGRFHGIIAWHSFFHLRAEAQRALFPRFRRATHPGAALLFTSGPAAGEAIGCLWGRPLYHASLSPEDYRAALAENGFDLIDHRAEDAECGGATVWLARCREE